MENLKIRVNSEAESKEAQELFFELDYNWFKKGYVEVKTPETIMSLENGALSTGIRGSINHKEITLPELRDLVVLKRNNREDANVSEENCLYDLYLTESKELYFYHCGKNKWILSNLNGDDDYYESLKPIEKKEMKEYLIKSGDGKYLLTHHDSIGAIEIPEGAESFNYFGNEGNVFFLKNNSEITLYSNETEDWAWQDWGDIDFDGVVCLWKRETLNDQAASADQHTLPEELPFIGDDFKLNIPEELKGRADLLSGRIIIDDECYTNKSDGVFSLPKSEPCDISNWVEIREEGSLNDQYAEIETVRQTLKTRQDQYGSFEDVAMITEQMVDIMRKGYYENLAYNQKMALYMICSKMARIVNGNPNHKDSWHDIAGYATLIDNELVSEKDMPF